MKKQFFENEKDGFYGTYYENPKGADCAVIGLFGAAICSFLFFSVALISSPVARSSRTIARLFFFWSSLISSSLSFKSSNSEIASRASIRYS